MQTNSATETPTRTASARIMRPLFEAPSLPRIMNTPAEASAPRMTAKASGDQQVHDDRLSASARREAAGRHGVSAAGTPPAAAEPAWRKVVVLLVALAAVALALRLGVWQLDRAAQKVALQAALDRAAASRR